MEREYNLKIVTPEGKAKIVTWTGEDGRIACERYAACFTGTVVRAWREVETGVFFYNGNQFIE